MAPKISIIVPVYNAEQYLERCINSILKQTCQDFEAIFVNDGSVDKSWEILQRYAQDERVTLRTQKNQGQSVARNVGLDLARGEYVYFCDSDDVMHPQLLETALYFAEKEDAGVVSFRFARDEPGVTVLPIADGMSRFGMDPADCIDEKDRIAIKSLPYAVEAFLACLGHESICPPTKLLRRSLLEKIRFIPGITFEDVPFLLDVAKLRPKTVVLSQVLYYYTLNHCSTMQQRSYPKHIKSYHKALVHICEAYQVPGYEAEWAFVQKRLLTGLLKQQFNRCRRSERAVRRSMFDAFAEELEDLYARGALPRHGHKRGRYWRYRYLMWKFRKTRAAEKAFDALCEEKIIPTTIQREDVPCKEISDPEKLCKHPVVSVHMMTYNHEAYIAKAIESIMEQKTDFEFELIIGDDASTDKTREICLAYQKQYPDKIRFLWSEENLYKIWGNDRRIEFACRGEYIAYCEGDDYWMDPLKLQKQVQWMREHDAGLCVARNLIQKDDRLTISDAADGTYLTVREGFYKYFHTTTYLFKRKYIDALAKDYPRITRWYDSMRVQSVQTMAPITYMEDIVSLYRMTDSGLWAGLNLRKSYIYSLKQRAALLLYGPTKCKYYLTLLTLDTLRKLIRTYRTDMTRAEWTEKERAGKVVARYCLRYLWYHPKIWQRYLRYCCEARRTTKALRKAKA